MRDNKEPLTRSRFHDLLRKAAQPIATEEGTPDQAVSGTAERRPSGGYTAKRKRRGKTGDAEGSRNG